MCTAGKKGGLAALLASTRATVHTWPFAGTPPPLHREKEEKRHVPSVPREQPGLSPRGRTTTAYHQVHTVRACGADDSVVPLLAPPATQICAISPSSNRRYGPYSSCIRMVVVAGDRHTVPVAGTMHECGGRIASERSFQRGCWGLGSDRAWRGGANNPCPMGKKRRRSRPPDRDCNPSSRRAVPARRIRRIRARPPEQTERTANNSRPNSPRPRGSPGTKKQPCPFDSFGGRPGGLLTWQKT